MNTILITILLLADILVYLIFFDVILSWLTLLGINFRPKIIVEILEPLYRSIKKIIPTTFGPFEFTPFIIILILRFIQQLIFVYDPQIFITYRELLKF